jgi:hypothetical protein
VDALLTVIGILGLGALLIAVWVFASAAKRYVSGENARAEIEALQSDLSPYRPWVERDTSDRRKTPTNVFPIMVNGMMIEADRRKSPERRRAA